MNGTNKIDQTDCRKSQLQTSFGTFRQMLREFTQKQKSNGDYFHRVPLICLNDYCNKK